jgi:aminoglycoside phosphotransferase (APT) family kinase protein
MSASRADAAAGPTPLCIWAGKEEKIGKRLFVYRMTNEGLRLAKAGEDGDVHLRREYENLVAVTKALAGTPLASSIPGRPVFDESSLEQDWLPGTPVTDLLVLARRSQRARRLAHRASLAAVRWLSDFHRHVRSDDFEQTSMNGGVHGDFKASNVLVYRDRISVIDWELFEPEQDQHFDLFHWTTSFGLTCAGSLEVAAIEWAFVSDSWIAHALQDTLHEYFRARGRAVEGLEQAYQRYIDDVFTRRTRLGLSNDDHFLHRVRQTLANARTVPVSLSSR